MRSRPAVPRKETREATGFDGLKRRGILYPMVPHEPQWTPTDTWTMPDTHALGQREPNEGLSRRSRAYLGKDQRLDDAAQHRLCRLLCAVPVATRRHVSPLQASGADDRGDQDRKTRCRRAVLLRLEHESHAARV